MESKKADVLTSKLTKLYGGSPAADAFIEGQVEGFLKSMEGKRMGRTDIQTFERRVEHGVKKLNSQVAEESNPNSFKSVKLNKEKNAESKTDEGELPLSYLVYKEATSLEHQRDEAARRRREHQKKMDLRDELDKQIELNRNKNNAAHEIEEKYCNAVRRDIALYKEEQSQKKIDDKIKQNTIRAERSAQMNDINLRREKEKRREQAEEAAMIKSAKEALLAAEDRRKQGIQRQKEYMEKFMAENEENKRIKAEKRRKDQEEEKRMQRENIRRLDEQERLRQETFERMKAKSSQNQQMFLQATAAKSAKEKEDEMKALAYQQEKIRKDQEYLVEEKKRREDEKNKLRDALASQVADREQQKRMEEQLKSEFVELYQRDARRAIEESIKDGKLRKQKAIEHRLQLLEQIEEKRRRENVTDESVMTDEEKKINKKSIAKLLGNDPTVVKTITIKLDQAAKVDEAKKRRAVGIRGGPADLAEDDF